VEVARQVTGEPDNQTAVAKFRAKLNSSESYFNTEPIPKNESDEEAHKKCSDIEGAKKYCPKRWAALELWMAESRKASFVLLIIPRSCEGPFYYIDTKALLENTPLIRKYTKFMRNYIRDSSGINIFTSEDIDDFTDIMFDPGLKQYLNLLVYDRNIFESFSDVFGNFRVMFGTFRKLYGNVRETFGQLLENLPKSSQNRKKYRYLIVCLYNQQNYTWLLEGRCRYGITPLVFNFISHSFVVLT